MTSPSSPERCDTAHVEGKVGDLSVAIYTKGCSNLAVRSQDYCKAFVDGPSANITKCEVSCCDHTLCNFAAA